MDAAARKAGKALEKRHRGATCVLRLREALSSGPTLHFLASDPIARLPTRVEELGSMKMLDRLTKNQRLETFCIALVYIVTTLTQTGAPHFAATCVALCSRSQGQYKRVFLRERPKVPLAHARMSFATTAKTAPPKMDAR